MVASNLASGTRLTLLVLLAAVVLLASTPTAEARTLLQPEVPTQLGVCVERYKKFLMAIACKPENEAPAV